MNKSIKSLLTITAFAALLLTGCNQTPAPSKAKSEVQDVSFPVQSYTFENPGEHFELTPTIIYKEGATIKNPTLRWVNSNSKAVSMSVVDKTATITALSVGTSYVSVFADDIKQAVCKFTVNDHSEEIIFTLNYQSLSIKPSESAQFVASVNGSEVSSGVKWSSSDAAIASIDENGLLTAHEEGNVVITAKYNTVSQTCNVTVSNEAVEFELSVSPTSKSIDVGSEFDLLVTKNIPEVEVQFVSSNPQVASVDNDGHVVGLKKGSATITVSGNGKSATCQVTVNEAVDPDMDVTIYFFVDYNNVDRTDTTGTKLLAVFDWYTDRTLVGAPVPANPTQYNDPAFPYFIGWSTHTIIDETKYLWNIETDKVPKNISFLFLYGIWSDVPQGEFIK